MGFRSQTPKRFGVSRLEVREVLGCGFGVCTTWALIACASLCNRNVKKNGEMVLQSRLQHRQCGGIMLYSESYPNGGAFTSLSHHGNDLFVVAF
jgi:hypothetical protein